MTQPRPKGAFPRLWRWRLDKTKPKIEKMEEDNDK